MTLFLTESQVEKLLTMPDAVRALEDAFRDLAQGDAMNRPRQRIIVPKGVLNVMPAGMPTRGYLGFKFYVGFKPKTRFWFHLFDANTGDPVALMQADRLGQQRTGAASGLATKYLAREDASVVGIIGTGWQAESQLQAVCAARKIQRIHCYSRNREKSAAFAKTMMAQLGIEVRDADTAQAAVADADIVCTITSSSTPVIRGEWLKPGVHLNIAGGNRIQAREVDDETLNRVTFICADSVEQAKLESGDVLAAVERGLWNWDRVHELSDVVIGKIPGRVHRADVTMFKSLGIALEDVAVAALVYERAREQKIGREIEL